MKRIYILILILCCSGFVYGNSPKPEQTQRYDQVFEAKIAFISTALDLSTKEGELFWPLYNSHWELKEKIARKRNSCLMGINRYLKGEIPYNEKNLRTLLDAYTSLSENEAKIDREFYISISKFLSLIKVAKLYKAEEDFRIKMILMLKGEK
ncbi:MAG: hypothetical protein QMB39_06225 [Bacteroidales bacterium]